MKDILHDIDAWTARGDKVAIAMVVSVKRSAPRPPGAKMAISSSGEVSGAVSGGCVEGAVIQVAEEVMAGGAPQLLELRHRRRGGVGRRAAVRRRDRRLGRALRAVTELTPQGRFAEIAREDGRGARRHDPRGARGRGQDAGRARRHAAAARWARPSSTTRPRATPTSSCGPSAPSSAATLFVDVTFPAPRLIIFGAIDFAAQLCTLARTSGWRPYVVDPRGFFARPDRFPDAEEVVAAWPEEAFERIGGIDRATSIAVLTHDPKLDDAALGIALRSDAAYVGAMGSRRAQEKRRERLAGPRASPTRSSRA